LNRTYQTYRVLVVGIVRLTIHQAKDLDASKTLAGTLNPLAQVFVGNTKAAGHTTRPFKHTNSPVWESPYEFICSDRNSATITIKVLDDRDFMNDQVVGYMSVSLTDLFACMGEGGRDWFPLSGCKSGRLRLSVEWKPLNIAGSLEGAEQYQPPIGVVKLLLDRATDVKYVFSTIHYL
jgi:Ca2+-dependent lipid-binding protein